MIFTVLMLLSTSVKRCIVFSIRDFHRISPLGRFCLVVQMSVCVYSVYAIFFRPLIGPQITWSVRGLLLVNPFFLLLFCYKKPFCGGGGGGSGEGGKNAVSPFVNTSGENILVVLFALVEIFGISRMRDFV